MSKEAMKLALEAMKRIQNADMDCDFLNVRQADQLDEAITALREALADQPAQQEPLEYWNAVEGWVKIDEVREHFDSVGCATIYKTAGDGRVPLTAAQRTWVALTDREIDDLYCEHHDEYGCQLSATGYERAIEAKLKEKNNG